MRFYILLLAILLLPLTLSSQTFDESIGVNTKDLHPFEFADCAHWARLFHGPTNVLGATEAPLHPNAYADNVYAPFKLKSSGKIEICDNGIDDDGDGFTDEADGACATYYRFAAGYDLCEDFNGNPIGSPISAFYQSPSPGGDQHELNYRATGNVPEGGAIDVLQRLNENINEVSIAISRSAPRWTGEEDSDPARRDAKPIHYFSVGNRSDDTPSCLDPDDPTVNIDMPGDINNPANPFAYKEFADVLSQESAVFSESTSLTSTVNKSHRCFDPVPFGQDLIDHIEGWNEQTKDWTCEGGFTPAEYAAFSSTLYDGHGGSIIGAKGPVNYNIGLVHSSSAFVFGGTHLIDHEYANNVYNEWFDLRTSAGLSTDVPYTAMNVHNYAVHDRRDYPNNINNGISPEEFGLKQNLINYHAQLEPELQKLPVWLSEFGYTTAPNKFTSPEPSSFIPNMPTLHKVSADWIARTYLESFAAGVQKSAVHWLADEKDENEVTSDTPWDVNTGIVAKSGASWIPKTSWFFTKSLRNILEGASNPIWNYREAIKVNDIGNGNLSLSPLGFDPVEMCGEFITSDCNIDCPYIYEFDSPNYLGGKILAIWSPSSCNQTYLLPVEADGKMDAISLVHGSTTGVRFPLELHSYNGKTYAIVPVSETPIFVVKSQELEFLNCPENIMASNITCSSASLTWDLLTDPQNVLYSVYTTPQSNVSLSASGVVEQILDESLVTLHVDSEVFTVGSSRLSNLELGEDYFAFVIPSLPTGNYSTPLGQYDCYIRFSTSTEACNQSSFPNLEITGTLENIEELFDEQFDSNFSSCSLNNDDFRDSDGDHVNFLNTSNNVDGSHVVYDFNEPVILNDVTYADVNGQGTVIVYGSVDNSSYVAIGTFETTLYLKWRSFSDFSGIPSTGFQYYKFEFVNSARMGELIVCATSAVSPPSIQDLPEPTLSTLECYGFSAEWEVSLPASYPNASVLYRVDIDDNIGFTSPEHLLVSASVPSVHPARINYAFPSTLSPEYYVRYVVVDAQGVKISDYSDIAVISPPFGCVSSSCTVLNVNLQDGESCGGFTFAWSLEGDCNFKFFSGFRVFYSETSSDLASNDPAFLTANVNFVDAPFQSISYNEFTLSGLDCSQVMYYRIVPIFTNNLMGRVSQLSAGSAAAHNYCENCESPSSNRVIDNGSGVELGSDFIEPQLSVYPNPSRSKVMIESSSRVFSIVIRSLTGQAISKVILDGESQNLSLDLDLAPGVYLITVNSVQGNKTERLIIN